MYERPKQSSLSDVCGRCSVFNFIVGYFDVHGTMTQHLTIKTTPGFECQRLAHSVAVAERLSLYSLVPRNRTRLGIEDIQLAWCWAQDRVNDRSLQERRLGHTRLQQKYPQSRKESVGSGDVS